MSVAQEKLFSKSNTPCRSRLVTVLIIYLNFQYFLLCCPFRLIVARGGQKVKIKTNLIQKILCFVCTILGLFWLVRNLQINNVLSNPKDPSVYLSLAVNVANLFLKFATVKRHWGDEEKLLQIANFILDTKNDLPFPDICRNHIFIPLTHILTTLVCILFTGLGIVHFLMGNLYFLTSVNSTESTVLNWNASSWWTRMLAEGRVTFFLDNQNVNGKVGSATGILAAIGYLWRLVCGANEELWPMIFAFIIWVSVQEFQARLQISESNCQDQISTARTWATISKEYEAIKFLTCMINDIFGWTLLCMVLQTTLYNSVNTDIFLNDAVTSWSKVIPFAIYSLAIASVFLLAADSDKKVDFKLKLIWYKNMYQKTLHSFEPKFRFIMFFYDFVLYNYRWILWGSGCQIRMGRTIFRRINLLLYWVNWITMRPHWKLPTHFPLHIPFLRM